MKIKKLKEFRGLKLSEIKRNVEKRQQIEKYKVSYISRNIERNILVCNAKSKVLDIYFPDVMRKYE